MNVRSDASADDFELPPTSAYGQEHTGADKANGHEHRGGYRKSEPFIAQRLDEIDAEPRQAVVQGLGFDEGAVGAIVGVPNAGKTAFALSLALHAAARADRWSAKVAGGPGPRLRRRSAWLRDHDSKGRGPPHGQSKPPLYISASVPGLEDKIAPSPYLIESSPLFATSESLEGEAVRLVAADTLAACLADGDENGDGMLRLVAGAEHIAAEDRPPWCC